MPECEWSVRGMGGVVVGVVRLQLARRRGRVITAGLSRTWHRRLVRRIALRDRYAARRGIPLRGAVGISSGPARYEARGSTDPKFRVSPVARDGPSG